MSQYGYIDDRTWAAGLIFVAVVILIVIGCAFLLGRCSSGYSVHIQTPVKVESK